MIPCIRQTSYTNAQLTQTSRLAGMARVKNPRLIKQIFQEMRCEKAGGIYFNHQPFTISLLQNNLPCIRFPFTLHRHQINAFRLPVKIEF